MNLNLRMKSCLFIRFDNAASNLVISRDSSLGV